VINYKENRPWGSFENLLDEPNCKVKKIVIDPGQRLSYQYHLKRSDGDSVIPVFDNLTSGLTNSHYIKKYYRPSGAVYSAKWDNLIENRTFFAGNIKGHIMSKENSVDIDDLTDIIVAESILTKVNK